ncbi:MAG: polysaccharide deacetylase family protein [Treponema sp.]|nr:polysaccharide deacetylase family protein [Treponema sp.]
MRIRHFFCVVVCIGILFAACRSITHSGADIAMPPSLIIFSFDDGPNDHGDTTARLLDVLKKHGIHALFCLLGENAERSPALVRRMFDEGHCIVNHGYSEKWAGGMGEGEFRDNLIRGEAAIAAALGHDNYPRLYRPHGGLYRSVHEKIIREAGYTLVPGSIRAYDAAKTAAAREKVIGQIIKKTEKQGGGIILLHDARDSRSRMEKNLAKTPNGVFDRSWIPALTDELIPALLDRGFIAGNPGALFQY